MKVTLSVLFAAVAAAAFASTGAAMPTGDAPVRGPGAHPMDCTKAKDQARCETLNKNIAACQDATTRVEHRKCRVGQLAAAAKKS